MFGGIPKHPFLHRIMDEMAERATIILKSQQEILDITGPGLLTDTYWDNYGMYTDITLLRNTDKGAGNLITMKSHATLELCSSSACRDMENGNLSFITKLCKKSYFINKH